MIRLCASVRLVGAFLFCILCYSQCSSEIRFGRVYDRQGLPVAGAAVLLVSVNDQGLVVNQLDQTITDGQGQFAFDLPSEANASVVVQVNLGDDLLRGFWAGSHRDIPVHPLTEALVRLVLDITESPQGRTLTDFSGQALRDITTSIFQAAIPTDLSSTEILQDFLRQSVGRPIALASGGHIVGQASDHVFTTPSSGDIAFATDHDICPASYGYIIAARMSGPLTLGLRPDGTLCGDLLSGLPSMLIPSSLQLQLPQETFMVGGSSFPLGGSSAATEDDAQVKFGPFFLQQPGIADGQPISQDNVTVARKVYTSDSGPWTRYLEIFHNTGAQPRTVSFHIRSVLSTSNDSALLTYDHAPQALSASDRFFAAYDSSQNRPTVAFLVHDGTLPPTRLEVPGLASGAVTDVTYGWTTELQPQETQIFAHYVYWTSSRIASEVKQALQDFLAQADMSAMTLMELQQLKNFSPRRGTVVGQAGAVIGRAQLTATNLNTNAQIEQQANKDGSFAIPLPAQSGDRLQLTASDGLNLRITVP